VHQLSVSSEVLTAIDEQIRRTELRAEQQQLSVLEQQPSSYRDAELRDLQNLIQKLANLRKQRAAFLAKWVSPADEQPKATVHRLRQRGDRLENRRGDQEVAAAPVAAPAPTQAPSSGGKAGDT
jgi:hypothetical protein